MDSLDDIVIGKTTHSWLSKNNALPSMWKISNVCIDKILGVNVGLLTIRSPGAAFPVDCLAAPTSAAPSKTHQDFDKLVILDEVCFDSCGLTRRESIAAILHEIGHHVYPEGDHSMSSADDYLLGSQHGYEVSADSFVIECGYEAELASALNKFGQSSKVFLNTSVQNRIQRLTQVSEGSK